MRDRYLEVTFRKGKVLAAYLYMPREPGVKSVRTEIVGRAILADFGPDGEVIGLELTAPAHVTAEEINAVLERLGLTGISPEELRPLRAA